MNLTHSNGKPRVLIVVAACVSVAAVIYATLSKLELIYRLYYILGPFMNYPSMRTYATIEHVTAYAVVGVLFSALYPRSLLRVCCFLVVFIIGLEVLQTLTPDRHGTLRDAIEKIVGGVIGATLGTVALSWRRIRSVGPTGESGAAQPFSSEGSQVSKST